MQTFDTYPAEQQKCPLCGNRTEYEDVPEHNEQIHGCVECGYEFIVELDGEELTDF